MNSYLLSIIFSDVKNILYKIPKMCERMRSRKCQKETPVSSNKSQPKKSLKTFSLFFRSTPAARGFRGRSGHRGSSRCSGGGTGGGIAFPRPRLAPLSASLSRGWEGRLGRTYRGQVWPEPDLAELLRRVLLSDAQNRDLFGVRYSY